MGPMTVTPRNLPHLPELKRDFGLTHRRVCPRCRRAEVTCYCGVLRPFAAPFQFGILQHPYESRNAIATARMAHLSVQNSHLFVGIDFSNHRAVNGLLADESLRHVMLYPSPEATQLEECFSDAPSHDSRNLFFWLLDAKWQHVRKMLRLSRNLADVPMVKFSPDRVSQFIIRKQPKAVCLSTIESIHLVIDRYFIQKQMPNQEHQALLDVFQFLVQQQLEFARVRQDFRHKRHKASRDTQLHS